MAGFLLRWFIMALAIWVAVAIIPGLFVAGTGTLLLAALVMGAVNAFIKPIFFWLTLPLTVLTLGVFLLVLNAAMLGLVALLVPGFQISGFFAAMLGSIVISIVSLVLHRATSAR